MPQEYKLLISSSVLKRTKERMILQIQTLISQIIFYIVRLLSLNRLIETQVPKNTLGIIGATLQA